MHMQLVTALIYWIAVAIWLTVLTIVAIHYIRNPRIFGTTRLLLLVVAIDTFRNLVENVYFGLFFGGQYGLFSPKIAATLGNPYLLIQPKLFNIVSGCLVLGLLLMRWLPQRRQRARPLGPARRRSRNTRHHRRADVAAQPAPFRVAGARRMGAVSALRPAAVADAARHRQV